MTKAAQLLNGISGDDSTARRSQTLVLVGALLLLTLGSCRTTNPASQLRDGGQSPAFREQLNSIDEYHSLARQSGQSSFIKYSHFFAVPAEDALHDRLYLQNTRKYEFHVSFLQSHTERYKEIPNYERLIFNNAGEEPGVKEITAGAIYLQEGRSYPGFSEGPIVGFEIYFRSEFTGGAARTLIDVAEVARFRNKLVAAMPFIPASHIAYLIPQQADFFRFRNPLQQAGVPILRGWNFHAFPTQATTYHPAVSYGMINRISPADFAAGNYTARDILVFDTVPLDVGPTAGIITAQPQVPHSHVIFRAVNLNIPDMFIPGATRLSAIVANSGRLVRFEAKADGSWVIEGADQRPGLAAEAEAYWRSRERQPLDVPLDLTRDQLFKWDGTQPSADLARSYGAKGTNCALLDHELSQRGVDRSESKHSFLIPFTFYERHRRSLLTAAVCDRAASKCEEEMASPCAASAQRCAEVVAAGQRLGDYLDRLAAREVLDKLAADASLRRSELEFARRLIRAVKPNDGDISRLRTAMSAFPQGTRIRLRSSTNAEDIAGLTGAGLYESKSACLGDDADNNQGSACRSQLELQRLRDRIEKLRQMDAQGNAELIDKLTKRLTKTYALDKSLVEVFSTLWTDRAFLSREYYRIDHRRVYMGILVHPSYVEEEANGVVVATFLADGRLEVNVVSQIEDISVTNPEYPNAIAEQVTAVLHPEGDLRSVTVVTRSNLSQGERVLSDAELTELARQIRISGSRLREAYPRDRIGDRLDIEFKLNRDREVSIKQMRPL